MTERERYEIVKQRVGVSLLSADQRMRERNTTANTANPEKGFSKLRGRRYMQDESGRKTDVVTGRSWYS